jgi:hypothetical protein
VEAMVLAVKFVQVAIFVQKTPEVLFLVLVEHTLSRVALKIYPIVSCAQLVSTVPQAPAILCIVLLVHTIHYLVRMILMIVNCVELVQHVRLLHLRNLMNYVLLVTFAQRDQTSQLILKMSVLPVHSLTTTT